MDEEAWKEILADEMEVYKHDTTWEDNGIIRNLRSVDHPWTCKYCRSKKLDSLYTCEQHCKTVKHQNALEWLRLSPQVPRWPTSSSRTGLTEEGSSSSGGTSSRAVWSGSAPLAADSRERPSAAPAEAQMCTMILADVIFNGESIGGATLVLPNSCPWAPPSGCSFVLDRVRITGDFRPADGSTVHGSSPFTPLPQPRTRGSGVDDPSSSRPPVTGTGSAPGPNSSTLPSAVQVVIVASRQPPRPPSPRPIDGEQQGARPGGATTACADLWQGHSRRLGDEGGYSSRRLGDWGPDSSSAASSLSGSADSPRRR